MRTFQRAEALWQRRVGYGLAVAAALWFAATTLTPLHRVTMIPILSRGEEYFPVPLLFWVGMLCYTLLVRHVFQLRLATVTAHALLIGVPLHIGLLIVRQWIQFVVDGEGFSSPVYLACLWLMTAVWIIGLGYWSASLWRRAHQPHQLTAGQNRWRDFMALCVPTSYGLALVALAIYQAWMLVVLGLLGGSALWWRFPWRVARASARRIRASWHWGIVPARWVWVVAVIAFGIRLFYLARILSDPGFVGTGADGLWYDAFAHEWAAGKQLTSVWVGSPGYIYFVGVLLRWFGQYAPILLVQVGLGALLCVLAYRIASTLFDRTVAALIGLVVSLDFPLIFASVAIGHQALDTVLAVIVLYCLTRYYQAQGVPRLWPWLIIAALAMGYNVASREPSLLFALFVACWLLWVGIRRSSWPRSLLHAATFLAITLSIATSIIAPLVQRGAHLYSERSIQSMLFTKASRLETFGWDPFTDPHGAWQMLLERPFAVIGVLAETAFMRLNTLFFGQDYGSFDPIFLSRNSPYFFGLWWYVLWLLVIGLLMWRWRPPAPTAMLALFVGFLGCRLVPHLVFESAYRYRPPMEPVLIMLAVSGAVWSWRTLRRHAYASRC